MLPPGSRRDATARSAHQQAQTDQERLCDRLDRLRFLADRHSEGAQADRTPAEAIDDRLQDRAVDAIQTDGIDLVQLQGSHCRIGIDHTGSMHLCPVAHPTQQPIRDARSPPTSTGDLRTTLVGDADVEQAGTATHDAL